ncbi:glutamate receptor ionotropic, kainate 2-like [Bolinopsis microptera]|uniref:glutamate receptor ionotropic, kainate 2-like n=1 Tax=Bolinopsis microptera TaxID=2820187 RepID=UPI003078E0BF
MVIVLFLVHFYLLALCQSFYDYGTGSGFGQPPSDVHIAVLYSVESRSPYQDIAEFAVMNLNSDSSLLPYTKINLIFKQFSSTPNSIVQNVCEVLKKGVSGIIVPGSSENVKLISDTASLYNVPVIAPTATSPILEVSNSRSTLIRMLPSDVYQSRALFDLLRENEWRQFAILTSFDSYGINGVLELQWLATVHQYNIASVQHIRVDNLDTLNVTQQLHNIKSSMVQIIVLNCNYRVANVVFRQANKAGMMGKGYSWVVTDGVTGAHHLLEQENRLYPDYLDGLIGTIPKSTVGPAFRKFAKLYSQNFTRERLLTTGFLEWNPLSLTIFTRLVYDAVFVLAHALHGHLYRGYELYETKLSCWTGPDQVNEFGRSNFWENGSTIVREIKHVQFEGITGMIEFGIDGSPYNKMYEIVNFRDNGVLSVVGNWSSDRDPNLLLYRQIEYLGKSTDRPKDMSLNLNGSHFRMGVMMETPFVIKDDANCTGTSCYRGYCVDLVARLSRDLHFTYELMESDDGNWGGYYNKTDSWDGLVKMLIDKKIEVAAVHLSINSLRERYIDFTVPFMDAGLMVVVKGETHSNSNKYFFLSPFSAEVWYCVLLACGGVTVLVCLVNKVSPFGKYGAKMHALMTCPCKTCTLNRALTIQGFKSLQKADEYACQVEQLEAEAKDRLHQLSMFNSSWMINASLLGQSPVEGGPYCASGRVILMAWWFFMMILSAMYTANLAAFLTVSRLHVGLQGVEDLLHQNEFKWGTVFSTNPEILMRNSVKDVYRRIIAKAIDVSDAEAGYAKAGREKFAFIYESPYLEYKQQLSCDNITDLMKVGEEFSKFGLAFGIQRNAPFAEIMNHKILEYKEVGLLEELWQKWLKEGVSCKGNDHSDLGESDEVSQRGTTLDMGYLAGLFISLGFMVGITIFIVVCELIYASLLDAYGSKPVYDAAIFVNRTSKQNYVTSSAPKFWTALSRRWQLLKYDLKEHWWTIEAFRKHKPSKKLSKDGSTQTKKHYCLQLSNSTSEDFRSDLQVPPSADRTRSGSVPGLIVADSGHNNTFNNVHILNRLREGSKEYENYSKSDAVFLSCPDTTDAKLNELQVPFSKSDADISTVIRYRQTDRDTNTSSSEMLS